MEYHHIIENHLVFVRITPNFLYLYNLIFVPILNVLIDKCQDKITKLKKLATKYDIEMSHLENF